MGEVYRARDPKLGRDVALKILPALYADDPERLSRFQREAHVLATLSHPNIATIFGLEETGPALVLELVEGPTLADRIAEGPLPVDEALAIARQIGDALDAAHALGIVHRDLKPANVKLRPDGTVKVLDFGLAKALAPDGASATSDGMNSPTLTARFTQMGVILGTAAYMSPEQARGKAVDKRADIWAFGCVLFEMVTGRRPFAGEDLTETLASVVKEAPDVDQAPPELQRLLRKCLEKDPKRRLRDIGDAWDLIDRAGPAIIAPSGPPRPATSSRVPWAVAALALLAAIGVGVVHFQETAPQSVARRFTVDWPVDGDRAGAGGVRFVQVSPDGRYLAIVAQNALWVRPLDSVEATKLDRTQGVTYPFWSPDSSSIGFFQGGQLKTVLREGGAVRTISAAVDSRGGTWSSNGTILFSDGFGGQGLARVSEQGGTVERVTKMNTSGRSDTHRYPQFLPDGRRFLFLYLTADPAISGVYLGSLDGAAPVRLLDGSDSAQFVPSSPGALEGFLLYRRQDVLMAQPFDAGTATLSGAPVAVATGVGMGENTGLSAFSAGTEGTLIYTGTAGFQQDVVWVDRSGKRERVVVSDVPLGDLSLSPDERTVSLSLNQGPVESEIYLQTGEGAPSRFTFGPAPGWNFPVWSPSGDQIAFASLDLAGQPKYEVHRKPSNGAGGEETLFTGSETVWLWDWSPDGKYLVITSGGDLQLLPLDGDRTPVPFTRTPTEDQYGQVSPDGRWMVYASGDRGQADVFVQPIPATGALWQVSQGGGTAPAWRGDGKELYYRRPDGMLMAVSVGTAGGAFQFSGTPQPLFPIPSTGNVHRIIYQPSANGQRFLVGQPLAGSEPPITVVLNWPSTLKK